VTESHERVGEAFARAIAAKDRNALLDLLDPRLEFRGMTPGRTWEADEPSTVVDDILLGSWFEPTDVIDALEAVDSSTVGDRHRVTYRLRIHSDEHYICEQTAYFDLAGDRIGWLRILCSGFQPDRRAAV
jgi:hypothetical protein